MAHSLATFLRMMLHDAKIEGGTLMVDGLPVTCNVVGYIEYNGVIIGHRSEGVYKIAPKIALASPAVV